jgi:hypothetical protein
MNDSPEVSYVPMARAFTMEPLAFWSRRTSADFGHVAAINMKVIDNGMGYGNTQTTSLASCLANRLALACSAFHSESV